MNDRPDSLVGELESGRFEFALWPLQTVDYSFERALGHIALRASPDLDSCIASYKEGGGGGALGNFPHAAVAISFLTQMHLHRSAWNGDLFVRVLTDFANAKADSVREGMDGRLIRDDADKAHRSLYVETRKPG